jgi:hypothetical protein
MKKRMVLGLVVLIAGWFAQAQENGLPPVRRKQP